MISKIDKHIQDYDLDATAETIFAEFEHAYRLHQEFDEYLKQNKMKRNKKSIERRQLFIEWFMKKYQGEKNVKQMIYELSELSFCSFSTMEKLISQK